MTFDHARSRLWWVDKNYVYMSDMLNKNIIAYEGKTVEELKADFEDGIDLYLESCEERGLKPQKPYSGSLNIRIPSELHSQLALKAQMTGRSINAIIKDLLTNQQDLLNT